MYSSDNIIYTYEPYTTSGYQTITCPGCWGDRVQTNKDGIKILCPVCNGKGTIQVENPYSYPTIPYITCDYYCNSSSSNNISYSR